MDARSKKSSEKAELYRTYVKTSAVGLELTLSVGVGMVVGYFVDRHFESAPVGLIVGFLLGVAAAVRRLIAFSRNYVRQNPYNAASSVQPKDGESPKSTGTPAGADDVGDSAKRAGSVRHMGHGRRDKDKYDVQ
jgi:F0F1-type ATP synthase assembly protein I